MEATNTQLIRLDEDTIFAFVSNLQHMSRWVHAIASIYNISDDPIQHGTTFTATMQMSEISKPTDGPGEFSITEYDPPRHLRIETSTAQPTGHRDESQQVAFILDIQLIPQGDGTVRVQEHIELEMEQEPRGCVYGLFAGIFGMALRSILNSDLQRLEAELAAIHGQQIIVPNQNSASTMQ